ncbi:MAG: hypothetical protein EOM69_08085, partial [Clostridia bacterium]|nr:hypothetical protein [Clostridia bacterium]
DVSGGAGTVTRCDTQEKREYAPKLYDLTTVQRDANRRYGLTAAKTLSIAQALYEKHKLITYPRTDCRVLPLDLRPQVLSTLQKLPSEYAPFVQTAVAGARKGGGVFQKEIGSDHHALIPTGKEIRLDKLPEGERKVMELILRRFLAAFFPPYVYLLQTIETQVESHLFRTALRARKDAGWKAVEGSDSSCDEDALLTVREGERYPVQSVKEQAHMTTPPKPYTDATLLSAMENAGKTLKDEALRELMKQHGLGTPATRAGMIERLLEVGYAQRKGRSLLPTEKGNKLIAVVPEAIASAETTGKWEYALNLIADGRTGDADFVARFMTGIEDMTRKLTQTVAQDQPLLHFDPEDGGKKRSPRKKAAPADLGVACPVCGQGSVTENEKAFGCSRWKEGCRFTLWKNGLQRAGGPALTAALVKLLLEKRSVAGSTGVLTLTSEGVFFEEKKTGQTHGPYPLTYDKEKKRKP